MRRLFFSLYAVVAVAAVGFILTAPWLFDRLLGGELRRSAEQVALAAQNLFEEELRLVPVEQWPAQIEILRPKFGYDLDLLRLDQIDTTKQNLQRLHEGLAALPDGDRIDYMLLPLRGSDYVVRTYLVQQEREQAQRVTQGFFYLLEQRIARQPGVSRAQALREIEKQSGISVSSVALSTLEADDRARLLAGKIVGKEIDLPEERYYKLMDDGRVMQLGPFPRYFVELAAQYLIWTALSIVMGIALYLWVRPLWRDMLALDRGALAISVGQLDARVQVSLRSPVRVLATTFNAMAQRVQELLKSQKEMADALSHELCTPISRLRFSVEMLENITPGADQQRYMRGILRDIEELESLVDEALTYSRLTHATARLAIEEVDLADWLEDVVRDAQRSAGSISLSSTITATSATGHFDPQLMTRALDNLVRNSLRHARSAAQVTISASAEYLDLLVEDDGPGIPPEHRAAIFEPFYRIDPSRQPGSGGHGLGLAIVSRICEQHEAKVFVEDSALGGALFRIRLPATARA